MIPSGVLNDSSPTSSPEQKFSGLSIAPGLAAGKAWLPTLPEHAPAAARIGEGQVSLELSRLASACAATREELREAARKIEEQTDSELADVFHAHEMMLDDLTRSSAFEEELQRSEVSAAEAVRRVLQNWENRFLGLAGESFRQKADDVADLARKLLRHLEGTPANPFEEMPEGSILVVERLLPSEVILLSRQSVGAVVVESLGSGAHAALLAREKSIPVVSGFPELRKRVAAGATLLVDAFHGTFIQSPEPGTEAQFSQRMEKLRASSARCRGACQQPAYLRGGDHVVVEANLGTYEDVGLVIENGADGVGLFRTEQLYLARTAPPSEDELLEELRAITSPFRTRPVTIRLLDVGGDKGLPYLRLRPEENPQLGTRGVRLLLQRPHLARTQLRALLRLSREQEIRILVPMVTMEEDLARMREMLDHAAAELSLDKTPPLGAMIETPAAALNVGALCRHADFLSVGTNDLTQYTMAAARDNEAVSLYYADNHVSVLRLLRIIVAEATKPLTVCGELAGREEIIPTLMEIGFRALSVSPPLVPRVKELIRSLG